MLMIVFSISIFANTALAHSILVSVLQSAFIMRNSMRSYTKASMRKMEKLLIVIYSLHTNPVIMKT